MGDGGVTALAVIGTLFAVVAICIAENLFVPASTFIGITEGEAELIAIAAYACAIILYIGGTKSGRASRSRAPSSQRD